MKLLTPILALALLSVFVRTVGSQSTCLPSWQSVFSGAPGIGGGIQALVVFDDGSGGGPALYVGGSLSSAGGVPVNRVAKWDGSAWSALGSGMSGGSSTIVYDLAVFDDGLGGGPALYAGGDFSTAGGIQVNGIARWNGSTWSALASGLQGFGDPVVQALTVHDDGSGQSLFAGGLFNAAGGTAAVGVAKWDGASWSGLGGGFGGGVFPRAMAFEVFDDQSGGGPALFAGGVFTSAGTAAASNVAKWNGIDWSPIGSGTNFTVDDLHVFDDGSGPALYLTGGFTNAGGVSASHIARWDGANWSALGSGLGSFAHTLAVFDDGGGAGPALYVGGNFSFAGGLSANRIARWDGTTWSAVGNSGLGSGSVSDLVVFDDGSGTALYVGGSFQASATGQKFLVKWGCPPQPFAMFCTAKTTLVCGVPEIVAAGSASASATDGFVVEASPVRGCRAGLLLYSNQPAASGAGFGGPGNGLLCLQATGLRRAGPIESGGTSPAACDGILWIDMNQFRAMGWAATGCNPAPGQNGPAGFLGQMGATIRAQMWGRDSLATGQVITQGIAWVVEP